VSLNNLPAVSFVKAPGYEDGHPGYSDPLDEQRFIVQVMNALMASNEWSSTAVIITYDDSDGWYDHQMPPIVNPSSSSLVDALSGAGSCTGTAGANSQQGISTPATPLLGNDGNPASGTLRVWHAYPIPGDFALCQNQLHRHTLIDQSSIIRFIEDNWLGRSSNSAGRLIRFDCRVDREHVHLRSDPPRT